METKKLIWNPFAKFFEKFKLKKKQEAEDQTAKNAQSLTQQELNSLQYEAALGAMAVDNMVISDVNFKQIFNNKKERVAKYREMSLYPEVSDGIDNIVYDSIVEDSDRDVVKLNIDSEAKIPNGVQKKIKLIWDYLINDIYDIKDTGRRLFRDWLIESELYLELIMDDSKKNIIGFKKIPCFTVVPVYKKGKIIGYTQNIKKNKYTEEDIIFNTNQVAYINYDLFGKDLLDTRGYLEAAIRSYNQLKSLEDCIIVYRLVRAPERKVWNIDVGRMPKGKAREFINQMVQRYKKKAIYDPTTGKINTSQNTKSVMEDYWFAKTEDGKGTTVETIGGNMELGRLDDLNYFLKKLYKVLKLPKSRWDEERESMYHTGKMGEITRDEVKFANFIMGLQAKFQYIFLSPFFTLLKMRGIDEKYIDKKFYHIDFSKSNLFSEHRKLDMLDSKLRILSDAATYIASKDTINEPDGIFSKEYVLKHMFGMGDEDYELNDKLKKQEAAEAEAEAEGEEEPEEDDEKTSKKKETPFGKSEKEEEPEEDEEESEKEESVKLEKDKKKKDKENKEKLLLNEKPKFYNYLS